MKKNHWGIVILGAILLLTLIPIAKFAFFKGKTPEVKSEKTEEFHEAKFWKVLAGGRVQCELCPNRCILAEGQRGVCKVRENLGGKLYSLVYGKPVSIHTDPIEKKPFYHFLPGSRAYSLATAGCNLSCKYCQNWDIAQRFPEDVKSMDKSPEEIVQEALDAKAEVIAFTYNEPTVWYEYMFDIAKLAKEKGLKTVMVSSGYINPEPLRELLQVLDAIKIDLKGFNEKFYNEVVGGKLEPVLEALKVAHESGKWLEIVNLVVPGYNDDEKEIRQMCEWIKQNLGTDIPLHFSRFSPNYKLTNLPPTPIETIKKARQVAMEVGLKYVYTGNVPEFVEGNTTFCPDNSQPLIVRKGWFVEKDEVGKEGTSKICPTEIPGVWE